MTRRSRALWGAALVALLLVSAAGAVVAMALERGGPIRIEVKEKETSGDDVGLIIPSATLACCLPFLPDSFLRHVPEDAVHHVAAARALCKGLEKQPDFVLADLKKEGETVRVEKRGDALLVSIDSPDETVRISMPLWLLNRVAAKLEAAGSEAKG